MIWSIAFDHPLTLALDPFAGADFVTSRGGKVVTLPLVPGLSTSNILATQRGEK